MFVAADIAGYGMPRRECCYCSATLPLFVFATLIAAEARDMFRRHAIFCCRYALLYAMMLPLLCCAMLSATCRFD